MKKVFLAISVILVFALIMGAICFKPWHRQSDNVFDQIYYEVETVKHGGESVLISGTESAYADYDMGMFQSIQIPALNMVLHSKNNTLYILFIHHKDTQPMSDYVLYKYEVKEKRIYGEESFEYLVNHFLTAYFEWYNAAEESVSYSLSDLGKYYFEKRATVYYY